MELAATLPRIYESKLYRPRRPERSTFYAVLYQFFDRFTREYEHRFERTFGPLRGIVPKTVERFFGCGLPEGGFARIRCDTCGNEYFVAFSCKQRGFCPSCSAKRAALWAEFVREKVIRPVPHRHLVFALPGEFLNWHPHLHVLTSAGAFRMDGSFVHSPTFDAPVLRGLFQANVLALLLRERLISPELVERMRDWRHSGFHAYAGEAIPEIEDALRVGLYMVRGPAPTSRLRPDPAQEPKVRYLARGVVPDHGEERVSSVYRDYDYLEWIARLTSHIPDRGTQLVHYYGAYSNPHRGVARRREAFLEVPPGDEPFDSPRPDSAWLAARRKSWARLIHRVYEADPLLCRCGERMRVVGFITQAPVIRKILDHVGRRFDPLKLPGRSPPLLDDFCPDPFPDYGPQ